MGSVTDLVGKMNSGSGGMSEAEMGRMAQSFNSPSSGGIVGAQDSVQSMKLLSSMNGFLKSIDSTLASMSAEAILSGKADKKNERFAAQDRAEALRESKRGDANAAIGIGVAGAAAGSMFDSKTMDGIGKSIGKYAKLALAAVAGGKVLGVVTGAVAGGVGSLLRPAAGIAGATAASGALSKKGGDDSADKKNAESKTKGKKFTKGLGTLAKRAGWVGALYSLVTGMADSMEKYEDEDVAVQLAGTTAGGVSSVVDNMIVAPLNWIRAASIWAAGELDWKDMQYHIEQSPDYQVVADGAYVAMEEGVVGMVTGATKMIEDWNERNKGWQDRFKLGLDKVGVALGDGVLFNDKFIPEAVPSAATSTNKYSIPKHMGNGGYAPHWYTEEGLSNVDASELAPGMKDKYMAKFAAERAKEADKQIEMIEAQVKAGNITANPNIAGSTVDKVATDLINAIVAQNPTAGKSDNYLPRLAGIKRRDVSGTGVDLINSQWENEGTHLYDKNDIPRVEGWQGGPEWKAEVAKYKEDVMNVNNSNFMATLSPEDREMFENMPAAQKPDAILTTRTTGATAEFNGKDSKVVVVKVLDLGSRYAEVVTSDLMQQQAQKQAGVNLAVGGATTNIVNNNGGGSKGSSAPPPATYNRNDAGAPLIFR